jgi:hypothetical protein
MAVKVSTDENDGFRYLDRLRPGQEVVIDGRRFARCAGCRKVIRTDKFLIGSLHLCGEE